MIGRTQFAGVMLLFSLALHGQQPTRKLLKLEAKFQDQKGAVKRAKTLAKLLPEEVRVAAEEIQEGEFDQGVARLEHWSAEAQQAHDALIATGRNAVKKPDGFTELQVALRESLRGLRNIVFYLPLGRRHSAETVQAHLSRINSQLLQELFPPPPASPPQKGKPK
ncbi:MAG TPA: hypothetical protein VNJ12_14155 [Candidatus Dormibacteraeota bacterium]|nr:hypothetical protein [Candidatus Dormibacteraeota bacterium]